MLAQDLQEWLLTCVDKRRGGTESTVSGLFDGGPFIGRTICAMWRVAQIAYRRIFSRNGSV